MLVLLMAVVMCVVLVVAVVMHKCVV